MFVFPRTFAIFASLAILPAWLSAQQPAAPAEEAPPAVVLQEKTRQWIETRRLIGEETAKWQEEKASLAELNVIRSKETAQLDEFVKAAEVRVAELGEKKAALAKEEEDLKAWRAKLDTDIARLEANLRPLLKRFPAPLRERVQESLIRLESPDPDQPLQNRARDVLLVLQACLEFQNTLTIDHEAREIGGERREVEVLYLGLTQAWYVDTSGKHSGHGVPGEEGWIWTEDHAIAGQVRSAIEIQARRATPAFVELPLSNKPAVKEGAE